MSRTRPARCQEPERRDVKSKSGVMSRTRADAIAVTSSAVLISTGESNRGFRLLVLSPTPSGQLLICCSVSSSLPHAPPRNYGAADAYAIEAGPTLPLFPVHPLHPYPRHRHHRPFDFIRVFQSGICDLGHNLVLSRSQPCTPSFKT